MFPQPNEIFHRTTTLAQDNLLGERYLVARETLGEGAFGAVMLATDMKDEKRQKYAIKKIPIDVMVIHFFDFNTPPLTPIATITASGFYEILPSSSSHLAR